MSPPGILERVLDYSQGGQLTSAAYGDRDASPAGFICTYMDAVSTDQNITL